MKSLLLVAIFILMIISIIAMNNNNYNARLLNLTNESNFSASVQDTVPKDSLKRRKMDSTYRKKKGDRTFDSTKYKRLDTTRKKMDTTTAN